MRISIPKIFTAVAILFLLSGCAKDLVTGKSVLNFYPLDYEPQFGNQVLDAQMKAALKKGRALDADADAAEYERLKEVVARLKPQTHYPAFPYEVHLMQSDVVNAWCAPGGKMMVYTGLWDEKKGLVTKGDEDELAAVLGHEMAHANARHVTEAMSRIQAISTAGSLTYNVLDMQGYSMGANIFGQVFSNGMDIYLPSYSRANEYEADRIGIMYMAGAGYDPRKAVALWQKAAKKKKDRTSIFASHPASGERAKRLEALLPEAMALYEAALKEKGGDKTKKVKSR
jgi:Zn-dependent protease with chaperone function